VRQVISSLGGEPVDAKKSFCVRNELEHDLYSAMTKVYMKAAFIHPSNFRQKSLSFLLSPSHSLSSCCLKSFL
jgi:hypothetical protein